MFESAIIEKFREDIRFDRFLVERRVQRSEHIDIGFWDPIRTQFLSLPDVTPSKVDFGASIVVGSSTDLSPTQRESISKIVSMLFPWRKGPFSLFGEEIDAEWRSDLKWERIAQAIGGIQGKMIGDVGCNNGYYMFRMLSGSPGAIIGLDPNGRYFYQFNLFQRYLKDPRIIFEPLGVEHLDIFPEFFDTVLFLGVLYHRRDPLRTLRDLFHSLREGGILIIESLTVPGDSDYCLSPVNRYAMMRNVWFIPSIGCLEGWLKKAGFRSVELVSSVRTSIEEQRKTKLAPYDSLEEFLDQSNPHLTCEGYPAPVRTIFRAVK